MEREDTRGFGARKCFFEIFFGSFCGGETRPSDPQIILEGEVASSGVI
jgi:hypothetical protein